MLVASKHFILLAALAFLSLSQISYGLKKDSASLSLARRRFERRNSLNQAAGYTYTRFQKRQNGTAHRYSTWSEAESEAKRLISNMTLEEKVSMTTGIAQKYCTGMNGGVPRLGIPSFCLSDGPTGVAGTYQISQFSSEITLAATWNDELARLHGEAMGQEFHDLGVNFAFAPVAGGPIGRSPLGGRNWESLGADEYLTGKLGSHIIKGLQYDAGVVACTKHFIGYEQETQRNVKTIFPQIQKSYSANIDDATMHHLYLWPFAEAARAGTGQVMCSYNRVNGTQQCQNDPSLNGLLKGELNFRGNVVSDYGGVYSNEEATNNGLDLLMPGDGLLGGLPNYRGSHGKDLAKAVKSGKVKKERLDDIIKRILTPILRFQYKSNFDNFINPKIHNAFSSIFSSKTNDIGSSVQRDHRQIIRRVGSEAITMVKNTNNSLPLNKRVLNAKNATIAVIGSDAYGSTDKGKSCSGTNSCDDVFNDQGTQTDGAGSGFALPPYVINPLDAIKAYIEDAQQITLKSSRGKKLTLGDDSVSHAVELAKSAEVALVFGNARAKEGEDRKDLTLRGDVDELIKKVAAVNEQTIVILHTPGPVLVEQWIDHPNVTAVLFAYYPGQESGNSLTPILFGDQSPSGRLPFVIAKKLDDWLPNSISNQLWTLDPQIQFKEGALIDWKWLDSNNITPRFPFGFGLSYANFSYDHLFVEHAFVADTDTEFATNEVFVRNERLQGESLYDTILHVSVNVRNTASMKAFEVVQLFVSFPDQDGKQIAPHLLRGFIKKEIGPNDSANVTFAIRRKDVSVWDVIQQKWRIPSGQFIFFVGPQGAGGWNEKLKTQISL